MKRNIAGVAIFALTISWVVGLVAYESKTPRTPTSSANGMAARGGSGFPFGGPGRGGPPRDLFFGDDFDGPRPNAAARPARPTSAGPGGMLAAQFIRYADDDHDGELTPSELTALADTWFDKLNPDHSEKLSQQVFADRLNDLLSTTEQSAALGAASASAPWGGGGYGRGIARDLFAAADNDKDASISREELKVTFSQWSIDWDRNRNGSLDKTELQQGLTAALHRP